ncbi:hypothetical protein [Roseateles aquatilis]|uniref:hypothetical protein n=1 Tax=Roseateles aquatilis TaxID=431061 RepID=UPI001130CD07|nr:hypothetical protein [Roseateles aquatilis]
MDRPPRDVSRSGEERAAASRAGAHDGARGPTAEVRQGAGRAVDQGTRQLKQEALIAGVASSPRQQGQQRRLGALVGEPAVASPHASLAASVPRHGIAGADGVVQGRFMAPRGGPMRGWVQKLLGIPSVAGMLEDPDFIVRFETRNDPEDRAEGYTRDEDGVLVIGVNLARVTNEGHALHVLTHELVLHAEGAWVDGSLENVLDRDTIQGQHGEIVEQRVQAPDQTLVDGSYRNAQRIVVEQLAEQDHYQSIADFVVAGMAEQVNVMYMTLQNHFAHVDQNDPPNTQYGRAFTSANLTKARNNIVLAWNHVAQTMQARRAQVQQAQRQPINQALLAVRAAKDQHLQSIDDLLQAARQRGL